MTKILTISGLLLLLTANTVIASIPRTSKVSSNDATEGYLNGKLQAGSGIAFTENNNGGDETLTLSTSSIPGSGINWSSVSGLINSSAVNWTNINSLSPINKGGVNWSNISDFTDGNVLKVSSGDVVFDAESDPAFTSWYNSGDATLNTLKVSSLIGAADTDVYIDLDAGENVIHIHPGYSSGDYYFEMYSESDDQFNPQFFPSMAHSGQIGTTAKPFKVMRADSFVGALTGNASTVTNGVYTTDAGTVFLAPNGDGSGLSGVVTAEVDPKVGTLTNTKWCNTDGSVINCTEDAPTATGTVTDVTATSPVTSTGGTTPDIGFNWDDVSGIIKASNMNWSDINTLRNILESGVNWESISGFSDGYVLQGVTGGSVEFVSPSSSSVNWSEIVNGEIQRSGINWDTFWTDATSGINWNAIPGATANAILQKTATGINWTSISAGGVTSVTGTSPVTSSGGSTPAIGFNWSAVNASINSANVNWNNINALAPIQSGGVNWPSLNNTIQKAAINWSSLSDSIQSSGINWTNVNTLAPIKTGGINWSTLSSAIQGTGINWSSLSSSIQRAGVNWTSLSQDIKSAGINWTNINGLAPIQSGGVNWSSLSSAIQRTAVNWSSLSNDIQSSGINWSNINTLAPIQVGGVNWSSLSNSIQKAGVNWSSWPSLYTDTKTVYIEYPIATDDLKTIWTAPYASTITKISCESDQTVNFDLQVDDGSPAGVNGSDIACTSFATDSSLAGDTTMAAGDRLDLAIASVSGTPTWVSISWEYTKDA